MKLTIALLAILLPIMAQDKKIDFTQPLIGADKKTIPTSDSKKPLTLGDVAGGALMSVLEEDKTATGEQKYKLFVLAQKVLSNHALTVDDIATIKKRIGVAYGPGVVGPAWNLLDPAVAEKK